MGTTLSASIEAAEDVTVRGIRFKIIRAAHTWPGQGDIFILRERTPGKFYEEFCGFSNFGDAKEFLSVSDEVCDWAGGFSAEDAPRDRVIEAVGCVNWKEEGGRDEDGIECGACGGQYPFAGKIRWHTANGWAGWVYASNNLAIADGIDDAARVTRWRDVS